MRKLIYSLGIVSFLAMMTFTVATSLTNPFYGMSEAAIAQTTTTTTTTTTTGSGCSQYGGCEPWETCIDGECVDVGSDSNNGVAGSGTCPDGVSIWRTCGGPGSGCSVITCD